MEEEKSDLALRVRATEERAKADVEALKQQREDFSRNLQRMEEEKIALANLVAENEAKAKKASKAVSQQLAKEREELKQRLQQMSQEKEDLQRDRKAAEENARLQAERLAQQLEAEKEALQETMERMRKEKIELAQHLAATEIQTQTQTAALTEQLAREKEALQSNMSAVEREKQALAQKLTQNQQQLEQASASAAQALARERMELDQRMAAAEKEKAELAEKLRVTEEHAKQRERLIAERLERERDELRSTVERMKEQLQAERKAMEQQLEEMQQRHAGIPLTGKRSLYDMLSEDGNKSHKDLGSFMSRSIGTIREEQEADESDEDSVATKAIELPAPHAAAAEGDVKRLKEMAKLNPSLLASFDESRRTPLFYAVAYDKPQAAEYLLKVYPDSAVRPDFHGDLPLHAATSAGSLTCVELLLRSMGGDVECRNHMNMSPAHMARNRPCLELLYRYGIDMSAVDSNGRSPLFVACAMNRVDCAEYIIECLDGDQASLVVADSRGDTPLHAAACNGAADCLLLLLQHAIDPRMTNAKGLKAIDLAIRNKQDKCRELLAEYHLHFCTNSQFDSVLFLATLEVRGWGHFIFRCEWGYHRMHTF